MKCARRLMPAYSALTWNRKPELERLDRVAGEMNKIAPVSLRVNPDVDAKTHPYISTGLKENKFGIPFDEAESLYASSRQFANLRITGLDCHIGSQLTELDPFVEACGKMLELLDRLEARDCKSSISIWVEDWEFVILQKTPRLRRIMSTRYAPDRPAQAAHLD